MGRYVLKRLLIMIPTIICVAILIFSIMYIAPGDPVEIMLGPSATPEDVLAKRIDLGLEDPYFVQLGRFLYNTFIKFDLGRSYMFNTSVSNEITARFPRTLIFAFAAMVIDIVVGTPLGVSAAVHQNGWGDRICMFISMAFVSIPSFWLALMMVLLFSVKLNLLPPYGVGGIQYWIMPVIANSVGGIAGQARQTRSSMLEVIRSDYVTTARAKGVKERDIIYKHALPNGLIPLITMCGQRLAASLGGTLIIENVFSIPGMGTYLTDGITNRDYPIVLATVVFLAIVFCFIMLLLDLCYAFVDPRIRAQYESSSARKRKKNREVKA